MSPSRVMLGDGGRIYADRMARRPGARLRTVCALAALILVSAVSVPDVLGGGSLMDTPFPVLAAVLAALLAGAWARPAIVSATCTVAAVLMTIANQRAHPGDYSVANDLFFYLLVLGGAAAVGWSTGVRRRQTRRLRQLTALRAQQGTAQVRAAAVEERNRIATDLAGSLVRRLDALADEAERSDRARRPEAARARLETIEATGRTALAELREVLDDLPPSSGHPVHQSLPRAPRTPPSAGSDRPRWTAGELVGACSGIPLAVETVTSGAARGPAWANVLASLLVGGVLLWRRRAPLASALAFFVLASSASAVLTPYPALVTALLPLSLVAYAIGEGTHGARLLGGTAVILVGVFADVLASPPGSRDPEGIAPTLVWLSLAVGAGVVVQHHARRESQLETLLIEIEQGRGEEVRLAVAEQRERMAHDLHDTVAHSMTVVCLHAGAAQRVADNEAEVGAALATVAQTTREAIRELRDGVQQLKGPLHPTADHHPRLADLARIAHETADGLGVPCTVDLIDEHRELEPVVAGRARRVLREALVNAARHAPGAPVRVEVRLVADLCLAISNPVPRANGFDHGTGTGLRRLGRWLASSGGRLDHGPTTHDYLLRAQLPVRTTPEASA